ncbi:MAG: acyltransferase family protein [Paraprevotella sp.]|nr:acyltransferase family protein [Paraprevotella sp.]
MTRLNYIDRLKGFAILLVVMGHLYLFPMHPNDTFIYRVIQSFHMPLFLFLSGYVIFTPPNLTNVKNKSKKYLLPMFVFGALFSLYIQQTYTWDDLSGSFKFLFAESKNGYWYFLSLTMFYLTLSFLNLHTKRQKLTEIGFAILFYIVFYIGWRKGGLIGEVLSLEHAACFYPFYVLGYLSRKYNLVNELLEKNWIFTMALVGYIILINLEDTNIPHSIYSVMTRYAMPTMAIIMSLFIFVKREKENSFIENQLAFLGKNTLSIYVLHFFIVYKINLEVFCSLFNDNSNTFTQLILVTIISIIVAYCSVYIGIFIKASNAIRKYIYCEK